MNIAGFRKCAVTFCTISVLYFFFLSVAVAQNLNMIPAKKNSHPKMSSYLEKLEKQYIEGAGVQRMVAQGLNISSHAPDKVTVYLMSEPGTSVDEDTLDNLGATIIKRSDNVIRAEVPIDMLTAVADNVKGVSFTKEPDKLIPVAAVTSQGVGLTGADTFGYTGSGVKVAVFDVGFIDLSSAITNNELPDNVVKVDCTVQPCNSNNPSIENVSNHGTAVAEIIHDMAPKATLYLIKVYDILDLKDAIDYIVNVNDGIANLNDRIRIINHSLVVPNTNFYDGECWLIDGVVPNAVCTADDAWVHNILWVNAAGNQAQQHYWADFTDSDSDGWHNVFGSSETIEIFARDGDTIEVYLTWDAWPKTDQDYNLFLYNNSYVEVASSKDVQTGTQHPTEYISYEVPADGNYYLAIRQENATSTRLQLYSINHNLDPAIADRSLLSPADALGAMAVGAINQNIWNQNNPDVELFSSRGPTNDKYNERIKPDIMGPDNVSTYVRGYFGGTSAATPHVTGAAALVLEKFPDTSADDLRTFLTSTATDMGTIGKDNIYGSGLLNLDINAVVIASSSTVTTSGGGGGGGGGGCFIATAAYGSYTAPCVQLLREMRDRFLIKNSIGKRFVKLYYKYSPPLADFIANHDNVKIVVRLSLLPLVGISWLTLKLGPMFTISIMVLFVFCLIRLFSNKTFSNKKTI